MFLSVSVSVLPYVYISECLCCECVLSWPIPFSPFPDSLLPSFVCFCAFSPICQCSIRSTRFPDSASMCFHECELSYFNVLLKARGAGLYAICLLVA